MNKNSDEPHLADIVYHLPKDHCARLEYESLEAENAELRGVLAWYGDEENHRFQNTPSMASEIDKDRGQRARDSIGQREVKDA